MKILTWNINGIRATKVPLRDLFDKLDADIICLQETKITRDQLDEPSAIVEGYNAYFSFSKVRSGYSGVATFVKDSTTPVKAEEGLAGNTTSNDDTQIGCYGDHCGFTSEELNALDREGRTMITQHRILTADGELEMLTVINVYCPRAEPDNEDRLNYKLNFYRLLQLRAETLLQHSHVIIVGDVNTSHKRIDHCDPDRSQEFDSNRGRLWLSQFLAGDICESSRKSPAEDVVRQNRGDTSAAKFVDMFRYFHPTQRDSFTCWRTTSGARATNYGTRIDYIFADRRLATTAFTDCLIRPDIEGSDHCPVSATLNVACLPSGRCPKLCTKFMPEFAGRQQKLMTFFAKKDVTDAVYEDSGVDDGSSLPSSGEGHAFGSSQGSSGPDVTVITSALSDTSDADKRCLSTVAGKRKAPPGRDCRRPAKQGNLLTFFRRPEQHSPEESSSDRDSVIPVGCNLDVADNHDVINDVDSHSTSSVNVTEQHSDCQQPVVDTPLQQFCRPAAPMWKTLLSGPPAAPPCRGHKEPCVLRTVKKDGPNKGRQFWVCARPEGHRTNRAARCEHFEWIPKKR